MREVTLFLIIFFFFSCKSSNGLKLLEAKELINNTKDYSISINKNWYSYSESHGLFWNSPKELKKERVIYYANKFSVNSSKSKHDNIEDLVNSKVNNLKDIYINLL